MKRKYFGFLLSAALLCSAVVTQAQAADIEPSSCATDTFYFTIPHWENADEASSMLAWGIRMRLSRMMISPGWENVRTVVAAASDRPFLTREYGMEQYNAKVSYRYCWELKD